MIYTNTTSYLYTTLTCHTLFSNKKYEEGKRLYFPLLIPLDSLVSGILFNICINLYLI